MPLFLESKNKIASPEILITGIPLDKTVCFLKGTGQSPQSLRKASWAIEDYSPPLKKSLKDKRILDKGDINLKGSVSSSLNLIYKYACSLLKNYPNCRFVFLGGEHTLSIPLIKAFSQFYPNLNILYFDAHMDLRESFQGSKLSHACTLRRILEIEKVRNVYILGARSGTKEEFYFKSKKLYRVPLKRKSLKVLKNRLRKNNVYVSFDFDFVDSCLLRSVSCPEGAGPDLNQTLKIIYTLRGLNIKGADFVEYNARIDKNLIDGCLCSKIIREFILACL